MKYIIYDREKGNVVPAEYIRKLDLEHELKDVLDNISDYANGILSINDQCSFIRQAVEGDLDYVIDILNSNYNYDFVLYHPVEFEQKMNYKCSVCMYLSIQIKEILLKDKFIYIDNFEDMIYELYKQYMNGYDNNSQSLLDSVNDYISVQEEHIKDLIRKYGVIDE